jgi:hypothetical protein
MISVIPDRIETDPELHPPNYTPEVRGCVFPEEIDGLLMKVLLLHLLFVRQPQ